MLINLFCVLGYILGEPSSPLDCAAVNDDRDGYNSSSEETDLTGWSHNAPLDGENVAEKMQSGLYSVDEPAKSHFDLSFTLSESAYGRYVCELFEGTHSEAMIGLGKYLCVHSCVLLRGLIQIATGFNSPKFVYLTFHNTAKFGKSSIELLNAPDKYWYSNASLYIAKVQLYTCMV